MNVEFTLPLWPHYSYNIAIGVGYLIIALFISRLSYYYNRNNETLTKDGRLAVGYCFGIFWPIVLSVFLVCIPIKLFGFLMTWGIKK